MFIREVHVAAFGVIVPILTISQRYPGSPSARQYAGGTVCVQNIMAVLVSPKP
jgi:hypothetical protein